MNEDSDMTYKFSPATNDPNLQNYINRDFQYDWNDKSEKQLQLGNQSDRPDSPIKDVYMLDQNGNRRKVGAFNTETGTKYGLTDPDKIQNPNNLSALGQSLINDQIQSSLSNNNTIVNSGDNQATESAKQTPLGTGDIQNNSLVNPATVQQTPKPDNWRPLSAEDVAKINPNDNRLGRVIGGTLGLLGGGTAGFFGGAAVGATAGPLTSAMGAGAGSVAGALAGKQAGESIADNIGYFFRGLNETAKENLPGAIESERQRRLAQERAIR